MDKTNMNEPILTGNDVLNGNYDGKQKQIEEMVETMANWAYRNGMIWHEGHAKLLAEVLLEDYQPKIPDAVVLTNENEIKQYEWSKMLDKMGGFKFADKVRNETVDKFVERLKEMAYQSTDWSHGEHPMVVEVDYIDEIANEIKEGKV